MPDDLAPHIAVRHYGPKRVSDPDCSSSIMITRGKFTRHVELENHDEVRSLIEKLQAAIGECSL